jgi:hypothetical protein
MTILKRMLPVGLVAGALGALAFVVPAGANTDTGVCQINGTATTGGVGVLSNTGTYSFNSGLGISGSTSLTLNCAGFDSARATNIVSALVTATSKGTFNNTVCGTGTADSQVGDSAVTALNGGGQLGWDLSQALNTSGYHLQFAGGQGALTWTGGAGSISGNGAINISAKGDGASSTICTHSFVVNGAVEGQFSGG